MFWVVIDTVLPGLQGVRWLRTEADSNEYEKMAPELQKSRAKHHKAQYQVAFRIIQIFSNMNNVHIHHWYIYI